MRDCKGYTTVLHDWDGGQEMPMTDASLDFARLFGFEDATVATFERDGFYRHLGAKVGPPEDTVEPTASDQSFASRLGAKVSFETP
jgi:hypothetical protein